METEQNGAEIEGQDSGLDMWPGPQTTSFDEIEGMTGDKPTTGSSALEATLEGDAVPEAFRGKKVSEVVGMFSNFQQALQASETARREAVDALKGVADRATSQPAPQPVAQAPAPAAEPTEAELKALFEEDPFKYQQKRFEMMERRMTQGVESRINPVVGTAADVAAQAARSKHAEAFEVLGKEINSFVDQAFPDKNTRAQVLSQPEAWDRIVNLVKGEHIDRIVEYRTKKASGDVATQRQQAEAAAAVPAFSGRTPQRPQVRGKLTPQTMDAQAKEVADKLMPDLPPEKRYAEYCKYYA